MNKIFTCFLVAISLISHAQQKRILCGNEFLIDRLEARYPGYKDVVNTTFDATKNNSQSASRAAGDIYRIPVVFHILWKNADENLADSVLENQIQVLNEDYQRLNADSVNTRSVFDSVAADCQIRFYIKQIIRVNTNNDITLSFFGLPDTLIKESNNGGSDAIDPANNLNIWVCNIQGGFLGLLLGYSYPPANMANWPIGQEAPKPGYDGVVLHYPVVGRNNPNVLLDPNTNQPMEIWGRTATHEIGHYLGLRHIWGDGGLFGGANDCAQSDGIDDTPFANAQSNFDCNKTSNTCSGTDAYYGFNVPDMVENYMDYSAESCMNLFTNGQKRHMRTTLETERIDLAEISNVGVSELSKIKFASAYPNPAHDKLQIKWSENEPIQSLQLIDVSGKIINTTYRLNGSEAELNCLNISAGFYYVQVGTKSKTELLKVSICK